MNIRSPSPTRHTGRAARRVAFACAAGALALVAGCSLFAPVTARPSVSPGAAAAALSGAGAADAQGLRAWAHELTREHCGACHIGSRPSAKPAALAIYDLDATDWPAALTPQRLRAGFTRRLNAKLDEAGRERLREFVESEIARRAK
jgi:hypothetical protein